MENLVRKIAVMMILLFFVFLFFFVIGEVPGGFLLGVPFMLFLVPFMCVFFWMSYTCTRFAAKINALHANPCQHTADDLLALMQNWGNFTHILLRSNHRKGITRSMRRS